jgi:hypothetical protein
MGKDQAKKNINAGIIYFGSINIDAVEQTSSIENF